MFSLLFKTFLGGTLILIGFAISIPLTFFFFCAASLIQSAYLETGSPLVYVMLLPFLILCYGPPVLFAIWALALTKKKKISKEEAEQAVKRLIKRKKIKG